MSGYIFLKYQFLKQECLTGRHVWQRSDFMTVCYAGEHVLLEGMW